MQTVDEWIVKENMDAMDCTLGVPSCIVALAEHDVINVQTSRGMLL